MIAALLLLALMQDGPVRTATEPAAQESADPRGSVEQSVAACEIETNRLPGEDEFDCGIRLESARRPTGRTGSPGLRVAPDDPGVPAWALSDPLRWETSQCGAGGDDACRRQARNRLAMARAGMAAEPPADRSPPAADRNCRLVMRRSETGFGGSFSRVCGEDAQGGAEAALDRLRDGLTPTVEPCDRPAALESHDAWIARCRALPER